MQNRQNAGGMLREQMQLGIAALKQGDTATARNIFSTLLEANPQMPAAHVGLGRVFASEGDTYKALEHFQEALAIKPDFAAALLFSAEVREKIGEVDDALA